MREHIGPILSLRDAVRARRLLWLFCRRCGHAERRDPRALAYRVGRDLSFGELAPRLACRRCKTPGKSVVLLSEDSFLER